MFGARARTSESFHTLKVTLETHKAHRTTSGDKIINPDLTIPPRPTISNVQWISGTQYFTPADLDTLGKLSSEL